MLFNETLIESKKQIIPSAAPVSNWSVALYRKSEPIVPLNPLDITQPITNGSFYIQLQQQATSTSPSRADALYLRYQNQRQNNTADSYTFPFTISQVSNMKLSADTASIASISPRTNPLEQQTNLSDSMDNSATLLLRAKAFLGILVLNSSANSITANTAGAIRPFMIFVTEEVFIGQLFDAYIFRILQVATISLRDNPEDEAFVSGIKKLFQARCFYYATYFNPGLNNNKSYFNKPYDITLCAQRMNQGQDADVRFFWNRALCLPLIKFNIDIRYWIPKVMCGGIETYRNQNDDLELWLISRLSCERAGTRFYVRGVNDDGAVANFVETEQIVFLPKENNYSSFVIVRGSIPLFWHQPGFQVGTHRITISRSELLSFKAFYRHFKYLYRHYGRLLIINLVDQRDDEKRVGEEYKHLFELLVKIYQSKQKKEKTLIKYLTEQDFIWFDYHEQLRLMKGLTPEQFVDKMLIQNSQYSIGSELERQNIFTYIDGKTTSFQQGVFRINCIDCLDRTNNVQLTIGMVILITQLSNLKKEVNITNLVSHLKDMWINNGDHISRIYTGTGAISQRSKAKDIQRSLGRAIQNNLRDEEKQQSMQTLIYSYAKDSYLHERCVAGLYTPYVISDGIVLREMFEVRKNYTRKETIRVSIGTWNINGDKNPALENEYPSILDAWMLDGPENMSGKKKNANIIPTKGFTSNDYKKMMPHILAIGFQEICDLTATNMVRQSSVNAIRWVENVESHFKKSYPNDEYVLLGNDQLVGVCLAIFIRRELTPFVKNISVDTVKTGMGGKIGNKGCVSIRFTLHNTSICFICAHFTAGQNEANERNKDYKSIMEKLSFQAPSRALWHDHIFFLGDFNYRLTIPRKQVEDFLKTESYNKLIEYDQLKREHSNQQVFQEFNEGPIQFPPTYKYDIGSDEYDTSEKARIPSYTDRILWRSLFPNVETKQLYYGRAEVKTSDHRPVSAIFDVDIELCDAAKMHQEYVNIYRKYLPSNAHVVFDMKTNVNLKKSQLIEEFDLYIRKKYGTNIVLIDRFFTLNDKFLSLNLFFENGEQARKVLEPTDDQLSNGISFTKRLIKLNDDIELIQKINFFFSDSNETMYRESIAYDLGQYQQPSNESLSTIQETPTIDVAISKSNERMSIDDDIERADLIKEAQRTFEQRRREYGEIFVNETDFDDDISDTDKNEQLKENLKTSSSDSSAPSSTDSDSPYGSDSESSSSYDEYHAQRRIPKKKIHRSSKGPFKSYMGELFHYWPKCRYKQYRTYSMKKRGIEINYEHIHTREIRHSLKNEKHQRKKLENSPTTLFHMLESVAKQTTFLSLDPEHPIQPLGPDRRSITSVKIDENDDENESNEASASSFNRMKDKFKRSFKKKSNRSKDKSENMENCNANTIKSNIERELISFASFDIPNEPNSQSQPIDLLADEDDDDFDPFSLNKKSTEQNYQSTSSNIMNNNSSTFHTDPFDIFVQERTNTNSSRTTTSMPIATSDQREISLKNLNLNTNITKTDLFADLLDLNDSKSGPESPKFDPYA